MDWQELTVLAVVALSAFLVGRRFWRGFKQKSAGCGCGASCGCAVGDQKAKNPCQDCSGTGDK